MRCRAGLADVVKKISENQDVVRVALTILNYFQNHPDAKDSAPGIAQWWTGEKQELVERALALLIQHGVITKRGSSYQLAHADRKEQTRTAIMKTIRRLRKNNNSQ